MARMPRMQPRPQREPVVPVYEEGIRLADPEPLPGAPPADWRTVPIPERLQQLPRDRRGYPVFVTIAPPDGMPDDGKVDFRVLNVANHIRGAKEQLCALCGQRLGHWLWFVGGPMCVINRVFGDGPMHEECMRYALQVCPHLVNPKREYSDKLPEGVVRDANVIRAKPERLIIYQCRGYQLRAAPGGKPVFVVPRAFAVEWYTTAGVYIARTRPTRYAQ